MALCLPSPLALFTFLIVNIKQFMTKIKQKRIDAFTFLIVNIKR